VQCLELGQLDPHPRRSLTELALVIVAYRPPGPESAGHQAPISLVQVSWPVIPSWGRPKNAWIFLTPAMVAGP
jgi:hypothetical protein